MDDEKVSDLSKIKISSLWDSLKRFDNYIYSTNFKCGLLATFNSALFGAVLLKSGELINATSGFAKLITQISLIAIGLTSLVSMLWVLKSIWPNLTSNSTGKNSRQPSIFFFASIATNYTAESYAEQVKSKSYSDLELDLAIQVHEVAVITLDKIRKISVASRIAAFNLILLSILLLTFAINTYGIKICQG